MAFQSTRPARGATVGRSPDGGHTSVSIHAPRAGRDSCMTAASAEGRCFNPRAPRGARHIIKGYTGGIRPFQSTRPARGATSSRAFLTLWPAFQSTRPARGATGWNYAPRLAHRVSIHAPRAGRDHQSFPRHIRQRRFNPRAPRGARPSFCKSFCGVMQSNTQRERCYLCNCQRANPAPWSHNSCSTRWLPSARTSRGFDERLGFAHIKK